MAFDLKPVLKGILSAAASAFEEAGTPPGRVELSPGNLPAWDDCCEGQLYIRVLEIFPSGAPFPEFDSDQKGAAGKCAIKLMAVHLGLGMIRCAHTLDDDGHAPTPEEVTEDGDEMLDDMQTLLDVIVCELESIKGVMKVKLDRWSPQGVQGDCHGGEWAFFIAMDPCLCPTGV